MMRTKENTFMFEEMMKITKSMSEKIDLSMASIFEHLQSHHEWSKVLDIKNQTMVARQDDERVGLLLDNGIRDLVGDDDAKKDDEDGNDLSNFVDTNLAVNILTTTAKKINAEFQGRLKTVMNRFGEFREGPVKTVERCQSKLENDYPEAAYPKAAKLLDLVRCSVSFNTVEQFFQGTDSFKLARVKNGFLDKGAAFRDIKVNVVYHSENDLENAVSIICEVQLILNQYLHEKKRIHKLYSILRERAYFEMVAAQTEDVKQGGKAKDIKELKFEPILTVKKDVKLSRPDDAVYKCSVEPQLGLLGVNQAAKWRIEPQSFTCVDMKSNSVIFETTAFGTQNHHWLSHADQKYLSLQATKQMVKMFKVKQEDNSFEEDETLRLCVSSDDVINVTEFDKAFENIFILKNCEVFEKRSISDLETVRLCVKLEARVTIGSSKQLSLSNDGAFCAIRGGSYNKNFFLIDLGNATQYKVSSERASGTFAPCFINGDAEYVAVGGSYREGVEIWNVKQRTCVKLLDVDSGYVTCTYSTNNILALCSDSGLL